MNQINPIRPIQDTPAEIIADLLNAIRNQFYPDSFIDPAERKRWFQDQNFIKRRFVLWPAAWLTKRGVSLPPDRYKTILLEVLNTIKRHGQTAAVKYWPGYLAHCIQQHFKHHGDHYYQEAKSIRALAERALLAFTRAHEAAPAADPVAGLAQVHSALKASHKPKRRKTEPKQLPLL